MKKESGKGKTANKGAAKANEDTWELFPVKSNYKHERESPIPSGLG